jgi:hypothetical protein
VVRHPALLGPVGELQRLRRELGGAREVTLEQAHPAEAEEGERQRFGIARGLGGGQGVLVPLSRLLDRAEPKGEHPVAVQGQGPVSGGCPAPGIEDRPEERAATGLVTWGDHPDPPGVRSQLESVLDPA